MALRSVRSCNPQMRSRTLLVSLSLIAVAVLIFVGRFNWRRWLIKQTLRQQAAYFHSPMSTGAKLERLTQHVYTFNWYFDRSLIIDTDDGLVVVDPFSVQLTTALKAALEKQGISKPVHTLIYTHYHLDHVRGGATLNPQEVIAHRKCPEYWADHLPADTSAIVKPTRLIDGDTDLNIGNVSIKLLYMGISHTDTNYAVYIPGDSVLYAADTVAVRALLPGGGVSLYVPGYLRALDQLGKLDFKIFVASHFGYGSKQDYLDAVQLEKDIHKLVREAMQKQAGDIPMHMDAERMQAMLDYVLPPLTRRYGDWHGFSSQALPSIFLAYTSEYVGD